MFVQYILPLAESQTHVQGPLNFPSTPVSATSVLRRLNLLKGVTARIRGPEVPEIHTTLDAYRCRIASRVLYCQAVHFIHSLIPAQGTLLYFPHIKCYTSLVCDTFPNSSSRTSPYSLQQIPWRFLIP